MFLSNLRSASNFIFESSVWLLPDCPVKPSSNLYDHGLSSVATCAVAEQVNAIADAAMIFAVFLRMFILISCFVLGVYGY